MFDDLLGPYNPDNEKKKKRIKINDGGVCGICGEFADECDCADFDFEPDDSENYELKEIPLDEECDCEDCDNCEDPWDGEIPAEQDIGCLKNDEGRNCIDNCWECELQDCLHPVNQ